MFMSKLPGSTGSADRIRLWIKKDAHIGVIVIYVWET